LGSDLPENEWRIVSQKKHRCIGQFIRFSSASMAQAGVDIEPEVTRMACLDR
jgi:hypothetical protein